MELSFRPIGAADRLRLADWLAGSPWPFHGSPVQSRAEVLKAFDGGRFTGEGVRSFWILRGKRTRVGFVRLYDLGDATPLFDLRIAAAHRGRGLGAQALRWLADYVFTTFPDKHRFEGYTRRDNEAMRRTFLRCGFVKEAHHRQAWPDARGGRHDAVGYALLRQDWASRTTTPLVWGDEPTGGAVRGATPSG